MFTKKSRLLAIGIASALALAACGGGGSGSDTTAPGGNTGGNGGTPTTPTTPSTEQYALQATVTTPSYGAGSFESASYSLLNKVRLAAGAGAVTEDAALNKGALAHSSYILKNPSEFGHTEISGHDGFTGVTFGDRLTAAGYTGTAVTEGVAGGSASDPEGCVQQLLGSIYHLRSLLGTQRDVGVGLAQNSIGAGYCVLEFGFKKAPQYPASGTVVAYPYSGQTEVNRTFNPDAEIPRPLPGVTGLVGQPVMASMTNLSAVTGTAEGSSVESFTLKDPSGNLIPGYVVTSTSVTLAAGLERGDDSVNEAYHDKRVVFFVPKAPLAASTTYTAHFVGKTAGADHKLDWSFKTKAN